MKIMFVKDESAEGDACGIIRGVEKMDSLDAAIEVREMIEQYRRHIEAARIADRFIAPIFKALAEDGVA